MTEKAAVHHDQWPCGLRVLVVDNDPLSLLFLQQQLLECNYTVTSCRFVSEAILMAVEDRHRFELVISDTVSANEDGLLLLKVLAIQMDIPVVMMSWSGETKMMMKYFRYGACDYLTKPLTVKELKSVWRHVLKKMSTKMNNKEEIGLEVNCGLAHGVEESKHNNNHNNNMIRSEESSKRTSTGSVSRSGSTSIVGGYREEEREKVIDDVRILKKSRLQWTSQLHRQFVSAVNALGLNKAVPKKIMEIMKVQHLTRSQVAAHLQKYRSYLKKLSSQLPHGSDNWSLHQINQELVAKNKIDLATFKSLQQFISIERRKANYLDQISRSLDSDPNTSLAPSTSAGDPTPNLLFQQLMEGEFSDRIADDQSC